MQPAIPIYGLHCKHHQDQDPAVNLKMIVHQPVITLVCGRNALFINICQRELELKLLLALQKGSHACNMCLYVFMRVWMSLLY